ncbi:hypothetical protein [Microcoleus sp. herbarium12]|uniref:hypothetical protein n=1 Tax=Microcoleus sp. herbarium12 TaxID=3055437 RepID=UPI002FD69EE4
MQFKSIAAWAIFQLTRRQQKVPTGIWILISLVTSIGIGSTLFHTFATEWAGLLDVIPIMLFQLGFLWLYSRQVVKMKYGYAGRLLAGFLWQATSAINLQMFSTVLFLMLLHF